MKMVAASRLRGTQLRMEASRGLPVPIVKLLGDSPGGAHSTPAPRGPPSLPAATPILAHLTPATDALRRV